MVVRIERMEEPPDSIIADKERDQAATSPSEAVTNTNNNSDKLPQRLPLPVTISLYNIWTHVSSSSKSTSKRSSDSRNSSSNSNNSRWFRPQHTTTLIPEIQLQILMNEKMVLYEDSRKSLQPCWRFLTEHLSRDTIPRHCYETLTARFTISGAFHFDICLHPSKLCRISKLPTALPLNCVAIEYSDDCIRIPPVQFQLLFQKTDLREILLSNSSDEDNSQADSHAFDNVGVFDSPLLDGRKQEPPSLNIAPLKEALPKLKKTDSIFEPQQLIEAQRETLRLENDSLEAILLEEETALERERQRLETDIEYIQNDCLKNHKVESSHCAQVDTALEGLRTEIRRTEFSMRIQRVRLITLVESVYPVLVSNRIYSIRGVALPVNILTGTDESIAAALGYLVHAVFLVSKYLNITLRYKLHCQSSKSAISNEFNDIFPLFRDRNLHEQFQYGYYLLNCNVETICRIQNIPNTSNLHILAKLQCIYDSMVLG